MLNSTKISKVLNIPPGTIRNFLQKYKLYTSTVVNLTSSDQLNNLIKRNILSLLQSLWNVLQIKAKPLNNKAAAKGSLLPCNVIF